MKAWFGVWDKGRRGQTIIVARAWEEDTLGQHLSDTHTHTTFSKLIAIGSDLFSFVFCITRTLLKHIPGRLKATIGSVGKMEIESVLLDTTRYLRDEKKRRREKDQTTLQYTPE
jgi:hypothetical protein